MKAVLLALCLFLYACRPTAAIVDTDDMPVKNGGGLYYLVPVSNHESGGQGPAIAENDSIPKAVVLDKNLTNVLPVRFNALERIAFISPGMFVGVNFELPSTEVAGWFVDLEFPLGWTVKVSQTAVLGGPFQIHPAKTGYKLVYYPSRSSAGADVGIVYSKGFYRLVVKDGDPFIFKIKKAIESTDRIMSVI